MVFQLIPYWIWHYSCYRAKGLDHTLQISRSNFAVKIIITFSSFQNLMSHDIRLHKYLHNCVHMHSRRNTAHIELRFNCCGCRHFKLFVAHICVQHKSMTDLHAYMYAQCCTTTWFLYVWDITEYKILNRDSLIFFTYSFQNQLVGQAYWAMVQYGLIWEDKYWLFSQVWPIFLLGKDSMVVAPNGPAIITLQWKDSTEVHLIWTQHYKHIIRLNF